MHILLISLKGLLDRHRGGIFKKNLRQDFYTCDTLWGALGAAHPRRMAQP